jgi:hypothetical protein
MPEIHHGLRVAGYPREGVEGRGGEGRELRWPTRGGRAELRGHPRRVGFAALHPSLSAATGRRSGECVASLPVVVGDIALRWEDKLLCA